MGREKFRQQLHTQSPGEMLKYHCGYTTWKDVLLSYEYNELSAKQANVLFKFPGLLDNIFETLEKMEIGHMQDVFDAVVARSNAVLQQDLVKSQHGTR